MSYAATRSSGGNHRSHSNSNNSNPNHHHPHHNHNHHHHNHNHHHHPHSHPHQHPAHLHHPHHHSQNSNHHSHHQHQQQHQGYINGIDSTTSTQAAGQQQLQHHLQQTHLVAAQPAAAASGSSSSSVSSTSSSSAAAAAATAAPQQQQVDDTTQQHITTLTAGHANPAPAGLATCQGPPHYVDLHVNAGECVSLQLFDGQEQLVAGPATITLVSQQQNPPVPIPVQVPPGHMIHQIADENGTLKHIILSVMDPTAPPPPPPPNDATGPTLDSTGTVISLPQPGATGVDDTFWNGNQAAGAIYQPPSYNNIVAAGGQNHNHYQQQQPPSGGPPSGVTNPHIYNNGKQQQQQQQQPPANTTTTNHGSHFRTSGASISPMRSRVKGQQQQHNHNQHHNHHHHHHNNHTNYNNNNSNSNHHHHHHQQQHHVHRSASSSSTTTASSSNYNNNSNSNHTHYHQNSISNNHADYSSSYHHNNNNNINSSTFASAAAAPASPAPSQQNPTPPPIVGKQSATDFANQNLQPATPKQVQDKSGPAWQPGNKFNHHQQQVQSKSLSPANIHDQQPHQQQIVKRQMTDSASDQQIHSTTNQKTNNSNKRDSPTATSSPSSKSAKSRSRERPTVDRTTAKQQSLVKETTTELDTTRVSRGKQKKHQLYDIAKSSNDEVRDVDEARIEDVDLEIESKPNKGRQERSAAGDENDVGEVAHTESLSVTSCAEVDQEVPIRPTVASPRSKAIKASMRISLSENNIQGLESAAVSVTSSEAGLVKSTQTTPIKSPPVTSTSTGGSKTNLKTVGGGDDDELPAPLQVAKKSTSVESNRRRRPSKGGEAKSGGLKMTALPQLKILNLSCTSVTPSSVQLRWSYVTQAAEKYGIIRANHSSSSSSSKHTHILDHFVIETSTEKNSATDTNQLLAPRVVYQGCAMTCRVAHLQADKIHHFRVRRTALVNAESSSSSSSGCDNKQEHLVVSEILSVTLPANQPVQHQQQQQLQQSKKKGVGGGAAAASAGMVISASSQQHHHIISSSSSSGGNNNSNSNHHHHQNHSGSHIKQQTTTTKLSNLSKQCRTRIVSIFGRMVKNSLSSCSDTKFAGLLLVLFTIFAMLLAIFIHLYFVAPVIE